MPSPRWSNPASMNRASPPPPQHKRLGRTRRRVDRKDELARNREIAKQLEYTREWGARLVVPIPTTTELA